MLIYLNHLKKSKGRGGRLVGNAHNISAIHNDFQDTIERKVIPLWSITVWLVVMNTTMFNVALPSVLSDFTLTASTASWIVSGYSIVFALSTITFSRLSDYLPIRRLLIIGLTLLGASSILGYFADQFSVLLSARLLQAAGAGAVPGLGMVLAGKYIPLTRRGKAMSMISSAASLGFGLGPVVGGYITQAFGWNYLFVVTGFVLLLMPVFKKLLPEEHTSNVTFDIIGGILTGLGVTGLLLFLSTFNYWLLLLSIVILIAFWVHIQRVKIPFIQPALLKKRNYMLILFIGFSAFLTHFATLFLMPIVLSTVFHKDPAAIGMIIFPGAMLSAVAAIYIGRLIDRFGNLPLLRGGQLMFGASTLVFAFFSSVSPYVIMIAYIIMSPGFSALTSSLANEVSRILPKSQLGSGMGLIQLIQFFGGSFGVALAGLLLMLQQGLSADLMYRHIYLGLTGLLVLSYAAFLFYLKDTKKQGT
jgi:MFS transporter, DHA2 family, metal-tetracycline-proton antiporter